MEKSPAEHKENAEFSENRNKKNSRDTVFCELFVFCGSKKYCYLNEKIKIISKKSPLYWWA
jgi:hypothetical protein